MKAHPLIALLLAALSLVSRPLAAETPLEAGFANPPEQTKPWCY
jgi:hypothetical protein